MDAKVMRFRAFLKVNRIPVRTLVREMNYTKPTFESVLSGARNLTPMFRECMRLALSERLGLDSERVDQELDNLWGERGIPES